MRNLRNVAFSCAAMAGLALTASAQRYTSPPADTSVTIDGKKISVAYYAPSMHGRKIMGSLVPYGEVWCPGANWATKITTDADLEIGGLKLAKGSYSLWAIPNEKEWTLVVNKQPNQFHLDYNQDEDLGRTKMSLDKVTSPVETLTIRLAAAGDHKGKLSISWENTEASIPFTVVK
jgi:hypothetical protein